MRCWVVRTVFETEWFDSLVGQWPAGVGEGHSVVGHTFCQLNGVGGGERRYRLIRLLSV